MQGPALPRWGTRSEPPTSALMPHFGLSLLFTLSSQLAAHPGLPQSPV